MTTQDLGVPSEAMINATTKVGKAVDLAIDHGDGSGLLSLRWKLDALLDVSRRGTDTGRKEDAIEREIQIWTQAIRDLLQPERRDAFIEGLRTTRSRTPDPWFLLDDDAIAERRADIDEGVARLMDAAAGACVNYLRSRRTGHLRDAVRAVEQAFQLRHDRSRVGLRPHECDAVADQLEQALDTLPDAVARLFVGEVRQRVAADQIRSHVGRAHGRANEDQWLSRSVWVESDPERGFVVGSWFVGELQTRYERELASFQQAQEADQRRRADEQANLAEWHARHAAELERPRVSDVPIPPRPDLPSAAPTKDPVPVVHGRSVKELSIAQGLAFQRRHDADRARQAELRAEHREKLNDRAYWS